MGLISQDIEIFHGTQNAYDNIRLPTATAADNISKRHGMDQYGIGFYSAANPENSHHAQQYAKTYAGDHGIVLHTKINAENFTFLNLDEPIGEEFLEKIQKELASIKTGTPDLDRYYQHIAQTTNPDASGRELFERITGNTHFENWHRSQTHFNSNEINNTLKADRKALNTVLEKKGFEIADFIAVDKVNAEQVGILQKELRNLKTEHPVMQQYYAHLADTLKPNTHGKDIVNQLTNSNKIQEFQQKNLYSNPIAGESMDAYGTKILNNLNVDGVYIPREDTIVFKGQTALDKLPDMRIHEIVGKGPSADKIHTSRPIAVGEVLIPSPSSHHMSSAGKGAVGLAIGATLALASGAASASNAHGGLNEKAQAFKESTLNSATDMLPIVSAEKAVKEGKPNEAIARLADWTPAGEPNRYLQRLHAAVNGKATDVEPGMIESLSTSTLDTLKYAANKGNEALDKLQDQIGLPTKRTTDAEKQANKNAFLQAANAIMAGDTNHKIPQNSHITVQATVTSFNHLYNHLSNDGEISQQDIKTLNLTKEKISEGFDAPLYGPLKGMVQKYEASQASEMSYQQPELSR